jgi:hypothetical protein
MKLLMSYLNRLGTTGGNDANVSQLVFIFAPLLCKPQNSAYMSVHHMEDLRKLRPILQILVENQLEIFKEAKPCVTVNISSSETKPSASRVVSISPTAALPAMEICSTNEKPTKPIELSVKTGLQLNIPTRNLSLNVIANETVATSQQVDVNDAQYAQLNSIALRPVNYQSKEWGVSIILFIF